MDPIQILVRTLQKYEVLRGGNLVGIEPITGQSSDGAATKCRGTRPGSGSTEKIATARSLYFIFIINQGKVGSVGLKIRTPLHSFTH